MIDKRTVLKWYCEKCISFKAIFRVNKYDKKICNECGENLKVKEVEMNVKR